MRERKQGLELFRSTEAAWPWERMFTMNERQSLCVPGDATGDDNDSPTDSRAQYSFKTLREESGPFAGSNDEDTVRQGHCGGLRFLLMRVDQKTVVIHCGCPRDQRAGINRGDSSSEKGAELGADRFG